VRSVMLNYSRIIHEITFSAYELYIATTTSTKTRTSKRTDGSGSADQTVEQYSENDNFGDKEFRMPGGYYEEPQTGGADKRERSSKGLPKEFRNGDLVESEALCARFKATLSRKDVKVHFLGAW
jgi:hypothetical protein